MGKHTCLYYHSQEDLYEMVGLYFKEGLRRNDFCLWIVPDSQGIEASKAALKGYIKDLEYYIEKGQFEILDGKGWYAPTGQLEPEAVLKRWQQKEAEARQRGFDAVCASGDGTCLTEDWERIMAYERAADGLLGQSKISALCTYPASKFSRDQAETLSLCHGVTLYNEGRTVEVLHKAEAT